jgi:chemotaxis protein methyltransferase CheR
MLILLKEEGVLENAKITVSTCSKLIVNTIKNAVFTEKQIELNKANYKRYKGKRSLSDYATNSNAKYYFDELIKNINFIDSRILSGSQLPTGQDIVLYRNKLIYFNLKMQTEVLNIIKESVISGGYFIVGIMENIFASEGMDKVFEEVSKTEKIYKKKL